MTVLIAGVTPELTFGDGPKPELGAGIRVQRARTSPAYDIDDGTFVLVRPDGYVGVISDFVDTVRGYLEVSYGVAGRARASGW